MVGPYSGKELAQYIVEKCRAEGDSVTPLQLMKLVYLCHGWFLGAVSRPLVKETFQAWQHGPVSKELYNAIREYRSSPVEVIAGVRAAKLDETEEEMVSKVVGFYSKYSGLRLSALTHEEGSPWHTTWLINGQNAPISNDLIEHFYSTLIRNDVAQAVAA